MRRTSVSRRSSNATAIINYPWTKIKEEIATFYNVDESKGLSDEQVKQNLERYGPNGMLDK